MKLRALIAVVVASTAILGPGCGEAEDSPAPAEAAQADPIGRGAISKLKPRMSKEEAVEVAGGEPVLAQGPTEDFSGGCIFFPLANEPLTNVLQVCFNDRGLNLIVTALSNEQPAPPEGASPARAVLLARGDSICQSEYGLLDAITGELQGALRESGRNETASNRSEVDRQIGRFIDNLDTTLAKLAAFSAPDDELEALTAYLEALNGQIEVLRDARSAFARGDQKAYEDLGNEFTQIGLEAKDRAREYGFSYCSASSWS